MANREHVAVVRSGTKAIAEWRRLNPMTQLDLSEADLFEANLSEANLSEADLSAADLAGCDFFGARLFAANLRTANLRWGNLVLCELERADLSGAYLSAANLTFATLTDAVLIRTDLTFATLVAANVAGSNFAEARFGSTSLSDVDLSAASGLATANHASPSSVGVDTLLASFRRAGNTLTPDLETFFRAAGVPLELLREIPRLVAQVKYYSCFISYGQPDLPFAQKLHKALTARGVSCWLYPLDRTPGKRTWEEISKVRREADRMVVLCSAGALVRDGVLKEIEEQIDEDPGKIIPVSLDDLWKEPGFKVMRGPRDLKPFLMERNYADFAGWDSDSERYDKALEELLRALRRAAG